MNQLMLLAQLCGDGKSTEEQLRTHGFNDLPAVAEARIEQLVEALGVSENAAQRMVREAERLMQGDGEQESKPDSARRKEAVVPPGPSPVTLSLASKPAAKKGNGSKKSGSRKRDSEVTPAEVQGLKPRTEKQSKPNKASPDDGPGPASGDTWDPSLWRFG